MLEKFVQTSCLNCSAINDGKLAKTQCQSKTAFDQPILIINILIDKMVGKCLMYNSHFEFCLIL